MIEKMSDLRVLYCPETVLIHSAFLSAQRRLKTQSLLELDEEGVEQAVGMVCAAVDEVLSGLSYKNHSSIAPRITKFEKSLWEQKIHLWFFTTRLRSLKLMCAEDGTGMGWPPLPDLSSSVYLKIITALRWENHLVKALTGLGLSEVQSLILEDVVSYASAQMNCGLYKACVKTFIQTPVGQKQTENTTQDIVRRNMVILTTGLDKLRKHMNHGEDQLEIYALVVQLLLAKVLHCLRPGECFGMKVECKDNGIVVVEREEQAETTNSKNFYHKVCLIHELESLDSFVNYLIQNISSLASKQESSDGEIPHQPVFFGEEIISLITLLCELIRGDWRLNFQFIFSFEPKETETTSNHEPLQKHPLHGFSVGLYGVLESFLQKSQSQDKCVSEVVSQTHSCLKMYVQACSDNNEREWIRSVEAGVIKAFPHATLMHQHAHKDAVINEKTTIAFEGIAYILQEHLQGYEKCFEQLLTNEQLFLHPDWLSLVQRYAPKISVTKHVMMMVDILSLFYERIRQGEDMDVLYNGLKKVILQVYSSLPIHSQSDVRRYVCEVSTVLLSDHKTQSLFFHPTHPQQDLDVFYKDMVMAFNQLVADSSESKFWTNLRQVSNPALVSPYLFMQKAVSEAVRNSGQIKPVCLLLHVLSETENNAQTSLLYDILRTSSCYIQNRPQELNLKSLITNLFKGHKFKNQFGIVKEMTALLSQAKFISTCVLPYLHHRETTSERVPTLLALQLLLLTLQTGRDWILHAQPFTLLYLLCELLDDCAVVAHGGSLTEEEVTGTEEQKMGGDEEKEGEVEEQEGKEGVTEVSVLGDKYLSQEDLEETRSLVLLSLSQCLEAVTAHVRTDTSKFEASVQWLYDHVQEMDWTVCLCLQPLWSCWGTHRFPLFIPSSTAKRCRLPDAEWSIFDDPTYTEENFWTGFLECCRVSSSVKTKLLDALDLEQHEDEQCLVKSLVEVLPQSIKEEWNLILETCENLIEKDIVKPKVQGDPDIFVGKRLSLTKCVLSFLLVRVFTASNASQWSYLSRHYVLAVKEYLLQGQTKKDLVFLCLVFLDVCQIISLAPLTSSEMLHVLSLDLLSQILSQIMVHQGSAEDNQFLSTLRAKVQSLPSSVHQQTMIAKINQAAE